MTDYLEELLESLEQEKLEQMSEWKRPVRSKQVQGHLEHEPKVWERPRNNGLPQIQQKETEPLEQEMRAKRRAAAYVGRVAEGEQIQDASPTQRANPATQPLAAEIIRLRRAVRQADAQVKRRTSQEIGVSFAGDSAARGVMPPDSTTKDYAAIVDMAFARDARRYDGPLGLL